jgi:uncharacterized protein (TIGR02453 family)
MEQTLTFLKQLKKNNNKEWFDKNKHTYLKSKEDLEVIVTKILALTAKFDKEVAGIDPAKTIFRIYKDVRFSKDKTPYKTNMGAHITPGGKGSSMPSYYIHIQPGNCFMGGGSYMPMPDKLAAIRQEIDYNYADFKKILNNKDFKKYYSGLMEEDKLVNPPKGYDKENPAVEVLKNKHFAVTHHFDDKELLKPGFDKYAASAFKAMHPFLLFLREAMK